MREHRVIDEELLEDLPRPAPLPAHRDLEAQELAGREDPGVLLDGLPGVGRLLGLLGVVGRLRLREIGETLLRLVEHGGLQGLVEHDAEAARTEIEDQGAVLVEAEVGGSSGGGGSSDSYRGRPTAALRSRVTATVGGSLAAANSGAESGDSALAACSARYGAHHGHVAQTTRHGVGTPSAKIHRASDDRQGAARNHGDAAGSRHRAAPPGARGGDRGSSNGTARGTRGGRRAPHCHRRSQGDGQLPRHHEVGVRTRGRGTRTGACAVRGVHPSPS